MEQQNQQDIQEQTKSRPPIKTNWKYIAIVAVFALLAIVGILLLQTTQTPSSPSAPAVPQTPPPAPVAQTPQPPAPSPQPQTLDTSDWQTYRNDEFEVKYPEDWEQNSQIASVHFERRGESNTAVEIDITSDQAIREACKTLLELNPKEKFIGGNAIIYTKIQDMTIDGIRGIRFSGKLASGMPEIPPLRYQEEVMACKENSIFSFALLIPSLAQEDENEIEIFNQILSTFRFIP